MTMSRIIFLVILLPGLALAGTDLDKATQLFTDMEYAKAKKMAQRVLVSPASGPQELVSAYRIRGLCLSAMGKTTAAVQDFSRLLAINPGYRLSDDFSPKIAAPFYQAVAMNKDQAISLSHSPPAATEVLAGLKLTAKLEADPFKMVKSVRLYFWTDRDPKAKRMAVRLKKKKAVIFKLPAKFKARQVHYYFEAANKYGGALKRSGSKTKPFGIKVKLSVPTPIAKVEKKDKPPTLVTARDLKAQPIVDPGPVSGGSLTSYEEEDDQAPA
jgi:tetratricopeptide (TPR) repeat protein